jgi:hypothetical protein
MKTSQWNAGQVTFMDRCRAGFTVPQKLFIGVALTVYIVSPIDLLPFIPIDDVGAMADYFLIDLAQLGDRLRGAVQTSVGATLDLFNHQLTRRLLSSPTPSFRLEQLQAGKILIIDMPIMSFGTLAAVIQMTLKFVFQLSQNRRTTDTNPRPVAMFCDEAQAIIDLEHDTAFGCAARSTRTMCVYATQSISNLLPMCPGAHGEARVHSLLGNLQTQIFHQTTDTKTVEYAQSLFGKRSRLLMQGGTSRQSADDIGNLLGLGQHGSMSTGFSEHLDHELQAEHFQQLEKGGPPHWMSSAIVYQGGRRFLGSGRPYLFIRLRQRPNAL